MDTRTVYTIMPDFGGAYSWIKQNGELAGSSQLGPCNGGGQSWYGGHSISVELEGDFFHWINQFESRVSPAVDYHDFDWITFHEEWLILAKRLKDELKDIARVFYRKPCEDPARARTWEWEIMADGKVVEKLFRL